MLNVRIRYALELVLVLAMGMALARAAFPPHDFSEPPPSGSWVSWAVLVLTLNPFMSGVALTGGFGLAIERIRGRSPATWGFGRWTWSLACLVVLLQLTVNWCWLAFWLIRSGHSRISVPPSYTLLAMLMSTFLGWPDQFSGTVLFTLIASLVTARATRALGEDRSPDGREWTGRGFALLTLIWFILYQIVVRGLARLG
jgi:hypothetical protein